MDSSIEDLLNILKENFRNNSIEDILNNLKENFQNKIKVYVPKDYYDCYTWALEEAIKEIDKILDEEGIIK